MNSIEVYAEYIVALATETDFEEAENAHNSYKNKLHDVSFAYNWSLDFKTAPNRDPTCGLSSTFLGVA